VRSSTKQSHLQAGREIWRPLAAQLCVTICPAFNWRAEQALRPAVVTRKVCGGNRTWRGARTQQVLASILRTIQQRLLDSRITIGAMLRTRKPTALLQPPPTQE
jgi:hypothetical protein